MELGVSGIWKSQSNSWSVGKLIGQGPDLNFWKLDKIRHRRTLLCQYADIFILICFHPSGQGAESEAEVMRPFNPCSLI